MNYKQKLGYMALGAGILAIGIIIGQWVTPDIEAQHNGVFDTITCRELKVVDQNGKTAIGLGSFRGGNGITIYDQDEKRAIALFSLGVGNRITIYDQNGEMVIGLSSFGLGIGNYISIYDQNGKEAFQFNALPSRNELVVHNKSDGAGIGFYADSNEARQITWMPEQEE